MTLSLILAAALALAPSAQSQTSPDSIAIRRVLDSARVLHVPEAPLRSLITEGRQRKEPTPRIVNALWSYVAALQQSRTALGAKASDAEVDAGASVILSGAPQRTLAAIRSARPEGDLTVALVVLADLVERGVPLTRAEDAVVTLTRVGTTDAAFNSFRAGVQKDLASGQGAESALIKRTRETVTQMNAGPIRKLKSFEINDAALVVAPEPASPVTTSDALSISDYATRATQTRWNVALSSAPITHFRSLAFHANAAGTLADMKTAGNTTAELIAALGARSPGRGIEGGIGGAAFSGVAPRLPFAYAAGWHTWQGVRVKLEARFAAGHSSQQSASDLEPLQVSFAAGDTAIHGTDPPVVTVPHTDSTPRSVDPSPRSNVSEVRFDASRSFGRFGASTSGGVRFVNERPFDSWNSFSLTTPVSSYIGAIVGFTSQRAMTLQSTPSGSHFFAGFRFMPGRRTHEDAALSLASGAPAVSASSLVRVENIWYFEFRAAAGTVEVKGDFSDWEPVAMSRVQPNVWRIALQPRALYKLSIRIDGGEWMIPAGAARARNAFGDEVGVLAITPEPTR